MEIAYDTLLQRPTVNTEAFGTEGQAHPFIVTLGGDHTLVNSRPSIFSSC
jgi:hypothetical protein